MSTLECDFAISEFVTEHELRQRYATYIYNLVGKDFRATARILGMHPVTAQNRLGLEVFDPANPRRRGRPRKNPAVAKATGKPSPPYPVGKRPAVPRHVSFAEDFS